MKTTTQSKYKCIQVVLKEKLMAVGNGNLNELEKALNQWYEKGYKLHTMSTSHTDSKGIGGGDRTIATCVLERIESTI